MVNFNNKKTKRTWILVFAVILALCMIVPSIVGFLMQY